MKQYLAYTFGDRAIWAEQNWQTLCPGAAHQCICFNTQEGCPVRMGWHTERSIFIDARSSKRGTSRMYPYVPVSAFKDVITKTVFVTAWEDSDD